MNFTRTEIKCEGIHLTFQDNLWEHSYKNKRDNKKIKKKIKGREGRVKGVWLWGGAVLESCLGHSGVKAECPLKEEQKAFQGTEISH